jgi:hypothetical protein
MKISHCASVYQNELYHYQGYVYCNYNILSVNQKTNVIYIFFLTQANGKPNFVITCLLLQRIKRKG